MNAPIPNNLRELRQKTGLRQIDVAQAIGLESSDRISHWEAGNKFPSVMNLFKLAQLYGVTPNMLYEKQYAALEKAT